MKSLTNYISEKLIINKKYNIYQYCPKTINEFRQYLENIYKEQGPGTKTDPIRLYIDLSNIDTLFYADKNDKYHENPGVFRNISFEYIDVSDIKISKNTDISRCFQGAKTLKQIFGLNKWNVNNHKIFECLFSECIKLESIDISEWNIKPTDTSLMFNECISLKTIGDISHWDMSEVHECDAMFMYCKNLKYIGDLSQWKISRNCINCDLMFMGCENLIGIGDISSWNPINSLTLHWMFTNCCKIKSFGNLDNWNVKKNPNKDNTFKGCLSLQDIPSWYKRKAQLENINKKHKINWNHLSSI